MAIKTQTFETLSKSEALDFTKNLLHSSNIRKSTLQSHGISEEAIVDTILKEKGKLTVEEIQRAMRDLISFIGEEGKQKTRKLLGSGDKNPGIRGQIFEE